MVNQAWATAPSCCCFSSQDAPTVLRRIERWRPPGVFGFAVTWAELARFDLTEHDLDSVRIWFNTGDCAHEPHIRHLVAVGSRETVTRDGRVTVPGSSLHRRSRAPARWDTRLPHHAHRTDTDRYGRCIGKPHRSPRSRCSTSDGEELPAGQVGHLGFKSPTLSPGYWNDSVTTYRTRLSGYYLTGDLVYRDDDGYYYHLDRAADAVDLGDGPAALHVACPRSGSSRACPDVPTARWSSSTRTAAVVTDVLLRARPGRRRRRPDRRGPGGAGRGGRGDIRRVSVVGRGRHPAPHRQGPQARPARANA